MFWSQLIHPKVFGNSNQNVNVINFFLSFLGQETAKKLLGLFSQAALCPPVYHTRGMLHTVPFIAECQAGKL